ncbi:MAG: DUF2255 family protein [Deltaproteobacteria bacterium]|nr:DUF2255 family protein [Deltaproteobacteria bacterium]
MSISRNLLVRGPGRAPATAFATALAVLVAVGASAVVPGIDWSTHADARTVVVLHADEDGKQRATTIWLCVSEGMGYVRGGGGRWVGNTRRNGDVALRIGKVELAVRATVVTDAAELERVTAGFRAKYGFGDVLATLVRGRPTIFRLEAR